MNIYPFRLHFTGGLPLACFSFIVDGLPLTALADGSAAPSCAISGRAAGDLRFDPPETPAADSAGSIHGPARERFFRSLGAPPDRVYSLRQVHSREVFVLGGNAPLPGPAAFVREGDGMVSFSREAFLAVTIADCLPVFLLDTERGFFALCHSGWRGTGIVLEALDLMRQGGSRPPSVAAVLGPCIQSCCYRVDEDRARSFEAEFGKTPPYLSPGPGPVAERRDEPGRGPGWYISLQAANVRLLAAAGVRHIACCEDCTCTGKQLGSFRREGPRAFTRMAALAGYFPGLQFCSKGPILGQWMRGK